MQDTNETNLEADMTDAENAVTDKFVAADEAVQQTFHALFEDSKNALAYVWERLHDLEAGAVGSIANAKSHILQAISALLDHAKANPVDTSATQMLGAGLAATKSDIEALKADAGAPAEQGQEQGQ